MAKINEEYIEKYIQDNSKYTLLDCVKEKSIWSVTLQCDNNHTYKTVFGTFKDGHRCKLCNDEKHGKKIKLSGELIVYKFIERNFLPLFTPDEYIGNTHLLPYKCNLHPSEIQEIDYSSLNRGRICCKFCAKESIKQKIGGSNSYRWKGGLSSINEYLRDSLKEWKYDSMKHCSYKCVISNNRFDVIHHLHGFDLIVEEVFEILDVDIKEKISDYSQNDLDLIKKTFISIHNKYPKGVCLTKENHELFHKTYGYGRNTIEQFQEFEKRTINNTLQ